MASSAASSLGLSQEELKAVELTRQRLFQLSNSIGSLKSDVFNAFPLPHLDSLQASADILQQNMRSLLAIVSDNQALFARVAVHPSTNFPGRTQENILLQLLRKKPEPEVEAALDDGRKTFTALSGGSTSGPGPTAAPNGNGTTAEDAAREADVLAALEAKWIKASNFTDEMFKESVENDDPYTEAEREMGVENVRTGLRRVLEEYEDESDEDGEGDGDGDGDGDGGKGGQAGADDEEEQDLVMLDRPPPPSLPIMGSQSQPKPAEDTEEGLPLENMLRMATSGELLTGRG